MFPSKLKKLLIQFITCFHDQFKIGFMIKLHSNGFVVHMLEDNMVIAMLKCISVSGSKHFLEVSHLLVYCLQFKLLKF